ncbi:MAG TPA: hypothetical protein VKY90_11910, partial [Candidatus Dormibacteraeota bacterium]|nr:hypothetical protein [Candidatus Dormibacteraeota bacterium]
TAPLIPTSPPEPQEVNPTANRFARPGPPPAPAGIDRGPTDRSPLGVEIGPEPLCRPTGDGWPPLLGHGVQGGPERLERRP